MKKQLAAILWVSSLLGVLGGGCGDSEEGGNPTKPGSVNVSQGGAQDFSQFRAIVDQGAVPSPDVLDPVGFFAEHAVDLPPATCGEDLCVHPSLAVAPRFNGGNWTMAFVGMNTPLDPSQLERPPLHVVLAVEASDWITSATSGLQNGVGEIVANLRPEDRISVVAFGSEATTVLEAYEPNGAVVTAALASIEADTGVSLYSGLAAAQRALDAAPQLTARRVVLLTTGKADIGITDPERIVGLGEAMARSGTALGVVGVGTDYDARVPAALGSLGAGSYSYALDGFDLENVLRLEGETTLFPLATNFELRVLPAPGYKIGRIYGVKRLSASPLGATLDLPALFIGQREGAKDVGGGRRGGGGGLFVELKVDPKAAAGLGEGLPAFSIEATWKSAAGKDVSIKRDVLNELAPGKNPAALWPSFSDPDRGKPFMMLNMFLALKTTVDIYAQGDCARALGVVDMMQLSVDGWQGKYDDPDILGDNQVLLKLRQNVEKACADQGPIDPIQPANEEAGCMMLSEEAGRDALTRPDTHSAVAGTR